MANEQHEELLEKVVANEKDKELIKKLMCTQIPVIDVLKTCRFRQSEVKQALSRAQVELCQEHRDAEARVSRCGRAGRPSLKYAARQDSGLACTCGAVLGYFEDRFPANLHD